MGPALLVDREPKRPDRRATDWNSSHASNEMRSKRGCAAGWEPKTGGTQKTRSGPLVEAGL